METNLMSPRFMCLKSGHGWSSDGRDCPWCQLEEYEAAFDYLETHVFEGKWDGAIGRAMRWSMAGPYRHELAAWQGNSLLEAIQSTQLYRA